MPYGTPPVARQLEHGRFNRFLATLPPHEFALLAFSSRRWWPAAVDRNIHRGDSRYPGSRI